MKKIVFTLLATLVLPLISVEFFSASADTVFDAHPAMLDEHFADFIAPITLLSPQPNQVLRNLPRNVGLGWQADGDAVSYEVELNCEWCNPAATKPWSESVVKKVNFYTSWLTPALAHDGNYRFRVRGIAKNGWHGAWSDYRNFSYDTRNVVMLPKPDHSTVLATPSIIAPLAEEKLSQLPRSVDLQWTAVSAAANYEVQFSCDTCSPATNKWTGTIKYVTKGTALSFDDLFGANDYRFRVRALEENGFAGPWSEYRYFSFLK